MQGLNSQFCGFIWGRLTLKYSEEETGLGKRLDSKVECARERKTKDLLTMEKCSIMRAREVSERSDEFGKTVRSPAEIQPLWSLSPAGCPSSHTGVGRNRYIDFNIFWVRLLSCRWTGG